MFGVQSVWINIGKSKKKKKLGKFFKKLKSNSHKGKNLIQKLSVKCNNARYHSMCNYIEFFVFSFLGVSANTHGTFRTFSKPVNLMDTYKNEQSSGIPVVVTSQKLVSLTKMEHSITESL